MFPSIGISKTYELFSKIPKKGITIPKLNTSSSRKVVYTIKRNKFFLCSKDNFL